jgi:hypothetical protein
MVGLIQSKGNGVMFSCPKLATNPWRLGTHILHSSGLTMHFSGLARTFRNNWGAIDR